MAEQTTANPNTILRDAAFIKHRIFIRNLPPCTRLELESICHPYGKVLAAMVQRNFGFVQFESEEIANKAASALNNSQFKGNIIVARNASVKPMLPGDQKNDGIPQAVPTALALANLVDNSKELNSDYNDCEIIVVDRNNCKYAEYIEGRLKSNGLRVDVLFPNKEVPLGKVLANISSRGCLYAVLVTTQHMEHRSITVNILHGQKAEHRNMPMEDAIKLIGEDFVKKKGGNLVVESMESSKSSNQSAEAHPKSIAALISLLHQNSSLTVLQYEHLIKYLKERSEQQRRVELGTDASLSFQAPDPEIQLQKKLLNVLNKPSVAETQYELLYHSLDDAQKDTRLMELLTDERVQRALESLMATSLVDEVAQIMKFK